MSFVNIEIKARTARTDAIRLFLQNNGADFKGVDHQTDTYYEVPKGRLKLRRGNIERALIYYERNNDFGPRKSEFNIVSVHDDGPLHELLENALGVKVVVKKTREIYFIGNIKFHLDTLLPLGEFVEIEASNKYAEATIETLQQQCEFYMRNFEIEPHDLVDVSYSDMLMALRDVC